MFSLRLLLVKELSGLYCKQLWGLSGFLSPYGTKTCICNCNKYCTLLKKFCKHVSSLIMRSTANQLRLRLFHIFVYLILYLAWLMNHLMKVIIHKVFRKSEYSYWICWFINILESPRDLIFCHECYLCFAKSKFNLQIVPILLYTVKLYLDVNQIQIM